MSLKSRVTHVTEHPHQPAPRPHRNRIPALLTLTLTPLRGRRASQGVTEMAGEAGRRMDAATWQSAHGRAVCQAPCHPRSAGNREAAADRGCRGQGHG